MIIVTTGSRLHFGLFRVPTSEPWPPGHWFGGLGLMIDGPGIEIQLRPSKEWSYRGPLSVRVRDFAERFRNQSPEIDLQPQEIELRWHPPEHAGFGLGTQLGMAVARGLASTARVKLPAIELAKRVGRGQRSAIGIHGFDHGGLIVDAGKQHPDEIGQFAARMEFPPEWRIVTATPPLDTTWHGHRERDAFDSLNHRTTEDLYQLATDEIIPAVTASDLVTFGRALHRFNTLAGEPFRDLQGGTYASPIVADLVTQFERAGLHGAGQSSWGPTVYGIAENGEQAIKAASKLPRTTTEMQINVSRPRNRGAIVREGTNQ